MTTLYSYLAERVCWSLILLTPRSVTGSLQFEATVQEYRRLTAFCTIENHYGVFHAHRHIPVATGLTISRVT